MKKIVVLIAIIGSIIFSSCEGPQGIPGQNGLDGQDGLLSEVFELKNINFSFTDNEYKIYQTLNPPIFAADALLIYRLSGTINETTPIWQPIPRTLFLNINGSDVELDYDFDFSKQDFTIYAGGNFNLDNASSYIQNQTFRIVILPGYFSGKSKKTVDLSDYNAVIKAFNIDDSRVKILN